MMSIYDFKDKFEDAAKMPYRPDWSYPAANTIYDENESVKWNKEKVLEEQARWKEEKEKLEHERLLASAAVEKDLTHFISNMIGCTEGAAKHIWERADHDLNKCEHLMYDYRYIKQEDH